MASNLHKGDECSFVGVSEGFDNSLAIQLEFATCATSIQFSPCTAQKTAVAQAKPPGANLDT